MNRIEVRTTHAGCSAKTMIPNVWWVAMLGGWAAVTFWLGAGSLYAGDAMPALALAFAQGVLTVVALLGLLSVDRKRFLHTGPVVTQFLALHVLIYYGFSNVVPALFPSLRPRQLVDMVTYRIPTVGPEYYVQATVAAIGVAVALLAGAELAGRWLLSPANLKAVRFRRCAWLPDYRVSLAAMTLLLTTVLISTVRYGFDFGNLLSAEVVANLTLPEQLLFHGVLWFLPIAPGLAAAAYAQACTPRQRVMAVVWMGAASLMTLACLLAWRMRSTAMIAIALPVLLLAYVGSIRWRHMVLTVAIVGVVIYAGVTAVRVNLETALDEGTGQLGTGQLLRALGKADWQAVAGRTLADATYRTAGLEGVAAIIEAQANGRAQLQLGHVLRADFTQALPASLRPQFEIPERVKTAPSNLGILQPGDWVTTFAAEFVLDFGTYGGMVPAFLAGLFLGSIDAVILRLGQRPALQGLLVMRFPILLYPVTIGASLADMTLLFLKATIGYWLVIMALACAVRTRRSRRPTSLRT